MSDGSGVETHILFGRIAQHLMGIVSEGSIGTRLSVRMARCVGIKGA